MTHEDDPEPCGENMCRCSCGSGHVCSCDCWRCDYCGQGEEHCHCAEEER